MKTVGVGRDFRRSSGHLGRFSNGKSRSFRENPQTRFFGRIAELPGVGVVRWYAISSSGRVGYPAENGRTISRKFGSAYASMHPATFHRMRRRSAGALCHASKILGSGATHRPSPNPHPRPLWNIPKSCDPSDPKTRPQLGQSPKITRSQSGKPVRHQFGSQHVIIGHLLLLLVVQPI